MASQSLVVGGVAAQGSLTEMTVVAATAESVADNHGFITTTEHVTNQGDQQQKTFNQQTNQQSILHSLTPDNLTSNNLIKSKGIIKKGRTTSIYSCSILSFVPLYFLGKIC